MCIANLLKTEINKLKDDDLIISVDLLDEFTQFVIFDASGPLFIKRLASIKIILLLKIWKKWMRKILKKIIVLKCQKCRNLSFIKAWFKDLDKRNRWII